MKPDIIICKMFGDTCRHCSNETVIKPFTKLKKNPVTRLYEPAGSGRAVVSLGQYCNNTCEWVENLHTCPARWALHRGVTKAIVKTKKKVSTKKAPTKKVPSKKVPTKKKVLKNTIKM
ncbi:MAG TPA: hypothetical protein VMY59_09505 [Candidatus Thermoplasmatota archaeon]|nr:hypothetical protein [Candidatus Thermoplasmatota archaeon]